jgi:hypothetical protein
MDPVQTFAAVILLFIVFVTGLVCGATTTEAYIEKHIKAGTVKVEMVKQVVYK